MIFLSAPRSYHRQALCFDETPVRALTGCAEFGRVETAMKRAEHALKPTRSEALQRVKVTRGGRSSLPRAINMRTRCVRCNACGRHLISINRRGTVLRSISIAAVHYLSTASRSTLVIKSRTIEAPSRNIRKIPSCGLFPYWFRAIESFGWDAVSDGVFNFIFV